MSLVANPHTRTEIWTVDDMDVWFVLVKRIDWRQDMEALLGSREGDQVIVKKVPPPPHKRGEVIMSIDGHGFVLKENMAWLSIGGDEPQYYARLDGNLVAARHLLRVDVGDLGSVFPLFPILRGSKEDPDVAVLLDQETMTEFQANIRSRKFKR